MDRNQKEEFVLSLRSALETSGLIVVTKPLGLTVSEVTDLRNKMRSAGVSYKVAKNSLARLAVKGTAYESLVDLLKGPTAIAYSVDPIAAAKIAAQYANGNDKFSIIGGAFGGQLLDVAGVKALATLPSLDELRGKLIGLVQAPATKVAGVVQAPAGQLARVVGAYSSKAA